MFWKKIIFTIVHLFCLAHFVTLGFRIERLLFHLELFVSAVYFIIMALRSCIFGRSIWNQHNTNTTAKLDSFSLYKVRN
jgi:hypothetical protein